MIDKIMLETEKAYMACFIDTDGTLTLRTRIKNGITWTEARIICFNCQEIGILEKLKLFTGIGCVTAAARYRTGKIEHKFVVSKFDNVEWLLKQVYPYMNLERKKHIARLLLELCRIRKNVRQTQHPCFKKGEHYKWSERIWEIQKEVTRLNKK